MTSNPKDIAQAFIEECNGGGVDRVVAFFSDDAVIKTLPPPPAPDPGIYTGKQAIRAWFDPQLRNFHVEPRNFQTNGETVTWDLTVCGDMFRQMGMELVRRGLYGDGALWQDYHLYHHATP